MTVEDILSHRYNAGEFYESHIPRVASIAEAGKEPLKLKSLDWPIALTNGQTVSYAAGVALACVNSILGRYKRKEPMSDEERIYLAETIAQEFGHYSVCDLKCFETMLVGGRLPTYSNGEVEYELIAIDIPHLMGKLRAYDRLRPSGSLTPGVMQKPPDARPLTDWQRGHLLDGSEFAFASEAECERYWRGLPDKDDARDQAAVAAIVERVRKKGGVWYEVL